MISLEKKQKFDLTKKAPGLNQLLVGLSWDETSINGKSPDADASVFMLGSNGKIPTEGYFVFFNNLNSPDGSVKHNGDNRTGAGDGDDETVDIILSQVSPQIEQILFSVTIHNASDGFNFGNTQNASVRIYNRENNTPLCEYKLQEQFSDCDSLVIGRLYRNGAEWEFEAMGSAFTGGLQACLDIYA